MSQTDKTLQAASTACLVLAKSADPDPDSDRAQLISPPRTDGAASGGPLTGQQLQDILGLNLLRFLPRTGKNLAVGMVIVLKLGLGRTLLATEQFLLASSDWITVLLSFHCGSCWFLGGAPRITA